MFPDDWVTAKLQVRSLRHDIAEAIRQAIRDRRLAPGARILETDLAKRFTVSRQPVREAIRMLEHEGLLTSVPNRGTFVTRVTRRGLDRDLRRPRGAWKGSPPDLRCSHSRPRIASGSRASPI